VNKGNKREGRSPYTESEGVRTRPSSLLSRAARMAHGVQGHPCEARVLYPMNAEQFYGVEEDVR
jgi:hypothetical protein